MRLVHPLHSTQLVLPLTRVASPRPPLRHPFCPRFNASLSPNPCVHPSPGCASSSLLAVSGVVAVQPSASSSGIRLKYSAEESESTAPRPSREVCMSVRVFDALMIVRSFGVCVTV